MTTHQQLLYHIVFSTKNRQRWLSDGFREKVFAFMAGTCQSLGGFPIVVGGYYDHTHLLIRIPAMIAVSDFVGKLKANTSRNVNETSGILRKFGWQDGYGAFTVSVSNKDRVKSYIENQMEHHQSLTFEDEYVEMLKKHEVEYDPRYVFDRFCRHFVPSEIDFMLKNPGPYDQCCKGLELACFSQFHQISRVK